MNPAEPALSQRPAAPHRARRRIGVLLDALYNEYASLLVTAFEFEARARDLPAAPGVGNGSGGVGTDLGSGC